MDVVKVDLPQDSSPASGAANPFGIEVAQGAARGAALCFFDVDGTLVWVDDDELGDEDFTDFGPNESVREAFGRLHDRGHLAFLCTGRPLSFVPETVRSLGFAGCITGAGACISRGDEIVWESLIERESLLDVAERALGVGMPVMLESRETTVIMSQTGETIPGFPGTPVARSVDELLAAAPSLHFCKLCSPFGRDVDSPRVREFRTYLKKSFLESNMGGAYEYNVHGVNKGSAIARVLDMLGRDARGTYAFGDSENDLPMFPSVETKVAMGNAMDVLKARADYVTGHAAEDGIAQALRHFGLI